MTKYAKDYIITKIENCENLIENVTSQEQKEIYQGYLDFWIKRGVLIEDPLILKKSTPDPVIESEETILDIEQYDADNFEFDYAPKQAYYKRNGQWIKTKAFKEYLNQRTQ